MHDFFLYQGFYPLHSKLPTRCTAISINLYFYFTNFFTFSAILSASNPKTLIRAAPGPDSPKRSLTPIRITFVGAFSLSASHTAPPSPPMMECSSTVTTFPVFFADAATRSVSSGLMVWMLITSASMPSSARSFAASRDSPTQRPVAIIVTSLPSFRVMPLPSSNL